MNLETLCFIFFIFEIVSQIYMASAKRVKKYWSVYVGLVLATFLFPYCLPLGQNGLLEIIKNIFGSNLFTFWQKYYIMS